MEEGFYIATEVLKKLILGIFVIPKQPLQNYTKR